MLGWIVLAFLIMPFVELYLLIQIGQRIGFWPTFGIVLATGLLGGFLVRWQGIRAWRDVLGALREGRAPTRELASGALFLVGAALLLTPGVITDVVGFAAMIAPFRRWLADRLIARIKASDRVTTHVHVGGRAFGQGRQQAGRSGSRRAYDLDAEGYTKPDDEVEPGEEEAE